MIDDRELNITQYSPICTFCKHLNVGTKTCKAFPKKIPNPIWIGDNDHKLPYPGDRGIQFAPLPDTD